MRKAVLVVGFLAIVLGVLWFVIGGGSRPASPGAHGPAGAERAGDGSELALAELPTATTSAREVPGESASPADFVPEPEAPRIVVAGTIVVFDEFDEFGREHPGESGTLTLWLDVQGRGAARHEVEVRSGTWTLDFPGTRFGSLSARAELGDCTLGGRPARPAQDQAPALVLLERGALALRMRWLPDALLHVRARDTRRELDGVFLFEVPPRYAADLPHPGRKANEEGREVGPSPVLVPALAGAASGARVLYVRSPGYAWGRVELDPEIGGEHEVLLDPAGELELVVVAAEPEPSTRVRLLRAGAERLLEPPVDDLYLDVALGSASTILTTDLPVGAYVVEARAQRNEILLGSTSTRVVAGRRSSAVLALEAAPGPGNVPLEGELVLPAAWELETFSLRFDREGGRAGGAIDRSAMSPVAGSRERFLWRVPPVPPGRYRIELPEIAFVTRLDTGPTGKHDALVAVPPPCTVRVRCVDDGDGSEATVEAVKWSTGERLPELHGTWDDALRCWSFRAPEGELRIETEGRRYAEVSTTLVAGPGTNEIELRLRPRSSIRVVLRDGTKPVRFRNAWKNRKTARARLETLAGDDAGKLVVRRGALELRVAPGTYRLFLPRIPGYAELPPRTLAVQGDGIEVIQLTRRP